MAAMLSSLSFFLTLNVFLVSLFSTILYIVLLISINLLFQKNLYTLLTYHHQDHQFRSWPTQMTSPSHLHTQARVQPRNTYNHTYIKFLPGQHKKISHLIQTKQLALYSVHSRLCRISEQSGPKNKQHCTMYGNAPKESGSYLRHKTHIQHTHSQHLSTHTQATTNDKSTHINRMG